MQTNSDIYLIGLSIALFIVITFFFLKRLSSSNELKVKIEEVTDIYEDEIDKQEELAQSSFNFSDEQTNVPDSNEEKHQELVIFNLISVDTSNYDMDQLFGFLANYQTKLTNGYFSYMKAGEEIFRIANALNPGTFESNAKTHAVIIVSDLNNVNDATNVIGSMLDFATQFSENFHASICDSNRLPLTKQMISHIESQAQEIMRLKQLQNIEKIEL
ncbi:MAG: cell division protein ZipA [Gammaproteobacteria bacterium TMED186]|jgi:FtsZ-interacting cell division protein ZipA|nr:MAG: cell division protein ZipA [Gammaproteobacteria bacterium TMED186]|tara:strand:+ start:1233 stop:1880 length:648 start_codon:yes stop_codon:yes gene_type:complete